MLKINLPVKAVLFFILVLINTSLIANSFLPPALTFSDSTNLDSTIVNAGLDTLICGFTYELSGNQNNGSWRINCADSPGIVSFSNAQSDTTEVKVSECGEYIFLYEALEDSCLQVDTVHVKFENPSSSGKVYDLDIDLELIVTCPEPDTVCGNEITIPGITEPTLVWNFFAEAECSATLFTPQIETPIDSCLVEDITYNISNFFESDEGSVLGAAITGDNLLATTSALLGSLNVSCPSTSKCFSPPPGCIESVTDTTFLFVPILDGGRWHYLDSNDIQQPLMDTTLIFIDTTEYAFILEQGATYPGPDDINVSVYQVGDSSELTFPGKDVELNIQWVTGYAYDTVFLFNTISTIVDSCQGQFGCCSNGTLFPQLFIPLPPPYPCINANLNFRIPNDQSHELALLPCDGGAVTFEVCDGQIEEYTSDGTYVYECFALNGCPYEVVVEVATVNTVPVVTNTSYSCDSLGENYTLSFMLENGQGDSSSVTVPGLGLVNYYELITIPNIPSCDTLSFDFTDQISLCNSSYTFQHCCACVPDSLSLLASICEGESYNFEGQELMQPGNYTNTHTNTAGCDSLVILILTVDPLLEDTINVTICEGESYDFYGLLLSSAGTYVHVIENQFTCDSVITLNLTVNPLPPPLQLNVNICEGEIYNFYGNILSTSGLYETTITDQLSCDSIVMIELTVLESSSSFVNPVICSGEFLPLQSGLQLTESGLYFDTLVAANGCDSIVEINLIVEELEMEVIPTVDCWNSEGGSLDVIAVEGGEVPYFYSITANSFQENSSFEELTAGDYVVQVMDSNNCLTTKEVTVSAIDSIIISLEEAYLFCRPDEITLDVTDLSYGNYGQIELYWEDGSQDEIRSITEPGFYEINVVNECEHKHQELRLDFEEVNLTDFIYVPNAFTPDGDLVNDEFKVYTPFEMNEVEFVVFDRWGSLIHKTSNAEKGWDGRSNGKMMNSGVYIWQLRAKVINCRGDLETVLLTGDLTLIE